MKRKLRKSVETFIIFIFSTSFTNVVFLPRTEQFNVLISLSFIGFCLSGLVLAIANERGLLNG